MWLTVFNVAIISIIVAMTRTEGFWGNLLLMFNAIFAAILASNLFRLRLDSWTTKRAASLIFGTSCLVGVVRNDLCHLVRPPTRSRRRKYASVSPSSCRGIIASLICGWIVVCFFLFSLHTAPLARTNFKNAFGTSPDASHFFYVARSPLVGVHAESIGNDVCKIGAKCV